MRRDAWFEGSLRIPLENIVTCISRLRYRTLMDNDDTFIIKSISFLVVDYSNLCDRLRYLILLRILNINRIRNLKLSSRVPFDPEICSIHYIIVQPLYVLYVYMYICTFLETRANCERATFHDMFVVVVRRGNKRKRKTSFEIPRHMLNGSSSTPFYPPYSFPRLLFPTSSVS